MLTKHAHLIKRVSSLNMFVYQTEGQKKDDGFNLYVEFLKFIYILLYFPVPSEQKKVSKFNHNIRDVSNTKDRVFDRISKTEKKVN